MIRIRVGVPTPNDYGLLTGIEGKPNADRTWTECFAQLVGTVLSLWDAAELDAAGQDGEVLPKFINLTDASIKMVSVCYLHEASRTDISRLNRFPHVQIPRRLYKTF